MRAELAAMLKTATPLTGGGESRSAGPDPFGGGSSGTSSVPGGFGRGLSRGHSYDDPTASWRALYGPPAHERAEESPEQPLPGDRQLSEPSPESSPVEALHAPLRNRAIQMHNLYLVAETDEGIIIVDQHALHERVMYEQLRERFSRGVLEAQRLLLPETVRVTADQMAALEDSSDLLARLGVEISPIGSDAVAVHTFPALLKNVPIADFLRDLVERLVELTDTSTEVIIHKVLDMMACKAAVKAGDELTQLEIDALIAKRHLVEKATSCPHGRPTMLRLTKEDLNRQFKRT